MKTKSIFLLLIVLLIVVISPSMVFSEEVYQEHFFKLGEMVCFNFGDGIYAEENFDEKGFLLPNVIQQMEKGIYLGRRIEYGQVLITVAIETKSGEPWVMERLITGVLREQKAILFNW